MVSAFENSIEYVWIALVEYTAVQLVNYAGCFTVANVIDILKKRGRLIPISLLLIHFTYDSSIHLVIMYINTSINIPTIIPKIKDKILSDVNIFIPFLYNFVFHINSINLLNTCSFSIL